MLKYIKDKEMLTPLRSIKKYCLDCSGGSIKEVKTCNIKDCPLYKFRLGTNPNRKGIGNFNFNTEKAPHNTHISN
jgi:hypothetical protein